MADTYPWIAVVDDDPAVLKALSRLLRTHDYLVRTYGSGSDLLASLPEGFPQCLIVDLQMPEMTGLELLQHLTRRGVSIPTILITAHGDAETRERCEAAGAATYLLKPLQDTALLGAIERAINV